MSVCNIGATVRDRIVGFDNERGKGDHCYIEAVQLHLGGAVDRGLHCCRRRGEGPRMTKRTLTITMTDDWRSGLRAAGKRATARSYQGEVLNFETAGSFFGQLTARRWALVHTLQGKGPVSVRELARCAGRDVRRVHDDVEVLTALGLVARTESGGVECPFASIHIDMRLTVPQTQAA